MTSHWGCALGGWGSRASVNEADEAQRPFCQTFMETLLRQLRSKIDEVRIVA